MCPGQYGSRGRGGTHTSTSIFKLVLRHKKDSKATVLTSAQYHKSSDVFWLVYYFLPSADGYQIDLQCMCVVKAPAGVGGGVSSFSVLRILF